MSRRADCGRHRPCRAWRHAVVGVCLVVWAAGCAPKRPPAPPPRPGPLPSVQELLAPLDRRMTQLTGLRGTATLSYRDAEQRGSVTQAVAVETPDRFRLEIFSLLGVAAVHVCDGQRLAAYFPREHVVYRGVASPANLGRFTRLHVSAGQVARLLLGLPPFPFATSAAEVRRDPPDGYRLDLPRADGGRAMLRFDTHTRQLGGWTIADPSGHIRVAGELRDYRAVAGRWFPFTMRLSDPVAGREISLEYREVSLDPTPSAALFTLDVPDGVQEIDLDAEEILTP